MNQHRLDIAVVIEHANLAGGQERVAIHLVRCWAENHSVTLYCYDADEHALPPQVHVVRLRPHPRSKLLGAVLFPWLSSRAIEPRHDIVLAQGGNCLTPNFSLFHTCHPLRRQTVRLIAQERGRPLAARERLNILVRQTYFERLERRTLLRCPKRCFAVSSRLADDLARMHKVPRESILVAPNGVDLATFSPTVRRFRSKVRRDLGLTDEDLVALFVGGIWWEKGLHVAIRALAQTRQPWHMVVVGTDDDAPAFCRLAQELGVLPRVHFVGRTDHPDRFYGAADCLLLPSGFEGFPLVGLEAAACGLPVLISRQAYPGELIDEATGCVLDRDPTSFAQALNRLGADEHLRRSLGETAAMRAHVYTWQRQAATLEAAFLTFCRGA